MDGDDCPGSRSDRRADRRGVQESVGIDVRDDRHHPGPNDSLPCREEREARDDDLAARLSENGQGRNQAVGGI